MVRFERKKSPTPAPASGKQHIGYRFSSGTRQVVKAARIEAERLGCEMGPEHLLFALLEPADDLCAAILADCGLDTHAVATQLRTMLAALADPDDPSEKAARDASASLRTRMALQGATVAAAASSSLADGAFFVETPHLLLGTLIDDRSIGARLLAQLGVTRSDVELAIHRSQERLDINLDDKSERVLYEQIVAQVSEAVAAGRVSPGYRLPTIRQLADDQGIAPGTVSRAYSILESRGIVRTSGSQGTFVTTPDERAQRAVADDPHVSESLRTAVVAARHAGMPADAVRMAFEQAMLGIYTSEK